MTRDECVAMDAQDPLAAHRGKFALPEGLMYLDGNSLGALPRATGARVREVIEREWGDGLIRSWNAAHWIDLPRRVGAKIAQLIGAQPHTSWLPDEVRRDRGGFIECGSMLPDQPWLLDRPRLAHETSAPGVFRRSFTHCKRQKRSMTGR